MILGTSIGKRVKSEASASSGVAAG